jgi:hypothetical protein
MFHNILAKCQTCSAGHLEQKMSSKLQVDLTLLSS